MELENFLYPIISQLYEDITDHGSYAYYLSSCDLEAWKKFRRELLRLVVCITVMINYIFVAFSAVQIHELSYFHQYNVIALLRNNRTVLKLKHKS